jgi:hypothetical protein
MDPARSGMEQAPRQVVNRDRLRGGTIDVAALGLAADIVLREGRTEAVTSNYVD